MTTREMLTMVINGEINDEIIAKAEEMKTALDKKNEKRSEKSSENRNANLEILNTILENMENGRTYAVSEIKELFENDYSNSKLSAVMRLGVDVEKVAVVDGYKVGGKGRTVKGYTKI